MRALVNPGLGTTDDHGIRQPVLAVAIPSLENGLWKLLPNGRMETTWTLRAEARWHDGTPVTTDDLLFTLHLGRQQPSFDNLTFHAIEEAMASDSHTITIRWGQPLIDADNLFATALAAPLPQHLLEQASHGDPARFDELSFWTDTYVGSGPFRVAEWTPGVGVSLHAFPDYVLGKPKLDQIDIKVVPDAHTMLANLLVGAVDITPSMDSVDAGIQLREQWRDGTVTFRLDIGGWLGLYPQFLNPQPPIIADVRFRRALLYAIDRQNMADALALGMSPVAHTMLSPNQPQYQEIEARVPRYAYDPRRAAELLEELSYRKGPDGIYRDVSDGRLELELRSVGGDQVGLASQAIADTWRGLGLAVNTSVVRPQQAQSAEYTAAFPAFLVRAHPTDGVGVASLHSSRTLLPENNFRVTQADNTSRYMNPALDALVDRYRATVPVPERIQVLGEIVNHVADQVVAAGLYYIAVPTAVAHRVVNVTPAERFSAWNSYAWDVLG
jgi:peptide/nickel transport system substrate-binding protein